MLKRSKVEVRNIRPARSTLCQLNMTRRSTIRPTAISLFSGAGGMDIGFERAGFRTLAAIEKDPSCCKTVRENLPVHTRVIEADIRDIKGDDLLSDLGLERGEVDVI